MLAMKKVYIKNKKNKIKMNDLNLKKINKFDVKI